MFRMNIIYDFLTLFFLLTFFGCISKGHTTNETTSDKAEVKAESKNITNMESEERLNTFAFNLYNEILRSEDDNLVISPFSISTAMAMAYGGSGGETKNQMSETLCFDPDIDRFHKELTKHVGKIEDMTGDDLEMSIANAMWAQYDYPFRNSYIKTLKEYYGSVFYKVDFTSDREKIRNEINHWVEKKTNHKIIELIRRGILIEDTRLVLVNAIYFLSNWLEEFDKELTRAGNFNIDENTRIEAKFMNKEAKFNYYEDEHAQVIEIPYSGENFSMMFFLPNENAGISDFEARFNTAVYEDYINNLKQQKVQLLLPKFKMRFHINLEQILNQMGMPLAFSDRADFSRMTDEDDLKIDRVIHQAFIEVDEKGTEAAAATAVTIIRKVAMPDEQIVFKADRPFNFIIKENKSNTILFMGRVINPAE